jgi:hypothetical protein
VYKYGNTVNESLLGSCRGNSILDEAGSVILLEIRRGLMWVDFNAEFNPNPVFCLVGKFRLWILQSRLKLVVFKDFSHVDLLHSPHDSSLKTVFFSDIRRHTLIRVEE